MMLLRKAWIAFALSLALALSGAVHPAEAALRQWDQPDEVSVLDVQAMVADVLEVPFAPQKQGVRAPAQVSVLDLQKLLDDATSVDPPLEQEPPPEGDPATVPAPPRLSWVCLCLISISTVDVGKELQSLSHTASRFEWNPPRQVQRYLYTLMPNAPPFRGFLPKSSFH